MKLAVLIALALTSLTAVARPSRFVRIEIPGEGNGPRDLRSFSMGLIQTHPLTSKKAGPFTVSTRFNRRLNAARGGSAGSKHGSPSGFSGPV